MAGISGSEIYFMNILPELNKRGIPTEFCCVQHPGNSGKNEKFLQHLKNNNVTCHIINSRAPVSVPLIWKLKALIRKEGYDIVQTNLIHADLWGALLRSFTSLPFKLVSVKHGYDEEFQKQFGFDHTRLKKDRFFRISKYANSKMDHAAAISEGLADLLVKGGLIPKEKIDVVHYGFDFKDKIPAADLSDYRYGYPQLIIVGRLIPVKQHSLVIQVLPVLKRKYPGLKLVLVGAGELEETLKKQVQEHGLGEAVLFAGFQSNIHDFIAASNLMLVPSSAEGFGVVILESWHNKIPVIAFDVPAPNEIIDNGINGFLVKPFDMKDMEEKIEKLLEEPEQCQKMGEAGYLKLQQTFTMDVMVNKTIALYRKALQGK
ncbi:MAG TPA: glycosyltransferase family 4 protein [Chitinophagaceae bacterium]|nr:glycosyltransferase family 4 protein [Chitinophagaceae bacterium]